MSEPAKIHLGKYELLKVIGDGAEGRVYKASCTATDVPNVGLGELVAVKRLKNTGHDKESQQFLRQIKILSKLNHPHIVRHKDSFVWREQELKQDIYCLVMELLDGEPLKAVLEQHRSGLAWERAGGLLAKTLQALQYASQNGVIHRDLKPSNIFITTAGHPKLVDFGIARHNDGDATATSSAAGAKGTFDYMAPDFALQPGGFRGDEQSDIFSFGVILYFTLAGSLPFPPLGEHADRGYYIRWLGAQPPSAEYRQPVFRVLSHARTCISKCIAVDRAARFKTFDEVMASFAQIGYRKLKHGREVYEFTDWLGKGGFGEVFRARRVSDQRPVAIKRLFSSGQSARFVREAKILRAAAHPNLTEYIDFVEVRQRDDHREFYLVLEYLEGMPGAGLRERIKNSAAGLDPVETLQLFGCYLACLEHLHAQGIIHRDLKPGNLYAPENHPERAKIFDLGIAHDEEGTQTHGQVPGTLDFMPPEFATQTSGRGSPQSDIYSLGVTLYQTLTKKLPFPRLPEKEAEAWIAFFRRAENPLPPAFDHPVFQAHPELVPLLRRALDPLPRKRFPNAAAMRDELRLILAEWEQQMAYQSAMTAGRMAWEQQDYLEVEKQMTLALHVVPSDTSAQQLLVQAQAERVQKQSLAEASERATAVPMVPATGHPGEEEATAATRPADIESILKVEKVEQAEPAISEQSENEVSQPEAAPRLPAASSQRQKQPHYLWLMMAAIILVLAAGGYYAYQWRGRELSRANREHNYQAALEQGQKAYQRQDYETSSQQAEAALTLKPADPAATKLKQDAQLRQKELLAQAELERRYQVALEQGQKAYQRQDYETSSQQTEAALTLKPADPAATKLKQDAQLRQKELLAQAELERRYQAALEQGQKAYQRQDYETSSQQAEAALTLKPADPAATKLKQDAQLRQKELLAQADLERRYQAALEQGQKAYQRQDYETSSQQAEAALTLKPADPAATKLKQDAQSRQKELLARADLQRRYQAALEQGQKAYQRQDYETSSQQAEAALTLKPGDPAATKLKQDARKAAADKLRYPTLTKAWENSLGMKFVPVAGTKVLFGIWDVRVKDYQMYAKVHNREDNMWQKPAFPQSPDHPVVNVNWIQAKSFCEWLTQKERSEGMIAPNHGYRLPLETEWNMAVGDTKYPWGEKKSPPDYSGNYAERLGVDRYEFTSPVGSFSANRFGLYDMGGNVWQWCENEYAPGSRSRVLRGASWRDSLAANMLSSYRYNCTPESRSDSIGFRVVLFDSAHTAGQQ